MKLWLRRFARAGAAICAVLFGGLLALYVIFLGAGISLSIIRPAIETAIEDQFQQQVDIRLNDVRLLRARRDGLDDRPVHLRLTGIEILDAEGAMILAVPALSLYPTLADIRRGSVLPRRADVSNFDIEIFRSATGAISIVPADYGRGRHRPASDAAPGLATAPPEEVPSRSGLTPAHKQALGAFLEAPRPALARMVEQVTMRLDRLGRTLPQRGRLNISNGRLVVTDETIEGKLILDRLVTYIEQKNEILSAEISGRLTGGSTASQFTIGTQISGDSGISVQARFSGLQAADFMWILGRASPKDLHEMTLTGNIEIAINPEGDLEILEADISSAGGGDDNPIKESQLSKSESLKNSSFEKQLQEDQPLDGQSRKIQPREVRSLGRESHIQQSQDAVSKTKFNLSMTYDQPAAALKISQFEISSGFIAGSFTGELYMPGFFESDEKNTERPELRLEGSDAVFTFGEKVFEGPLAFRTIALSTSWDWAKNELHITDIKGAIPEGMLWGDLTLRLTTEKNISMGVLADVGIDGILSHREVLYYWPVFFAQGQRNWVERNVISGNASNIAFTMDLARGAVRIRTPLEDDAMRLTFDISDAVSTYIPSMSPLEQVNGRGIVGGHSFRLEVRNGRVGNVRFHSGIVSFPWFFPAPIGEFGATLTGDTRDILWVINEPPLSLISKTGLSPEMFSGASEFKFNLSRPMQPGTAFSEYKFGGDGRFAEVDLTDMPLFGDLLLTDGTIELYNDRISVSSDALLQNIKTSINWERKFDEQGSTRYRFAGSINVLDTDNIGISSRSFFREGEIDYEILLTQSLGELKKSVIKADFKDAEISIDEIGYNKQINAPAEAMIWVNRFEAGFALPAAGGSPQEGDWLADISIREADNLAFDGKAVLSGDGMIRYADLSKLQIKNRLDAALYLTRASAGHIVVDIEGSYLKLDNLLDRISGRGRIAGGVSDKAVSDGSAKRVDEPQFKLDAAFDVVEMRNNIRIRDVDLKGSFGTRGLTDLSLAGGYSEGSYLNIDIAPNEKIDGRSISISTDDFGKTWSSLFDSQALEGGRGEVTATTLTDGTTIGTLEVSGTRLHDTPLIARLLSSASVQGLSDLLRNDGIELSRIKTDLEISDGVIAVKRARATGPSVGVSIDGDINLTADSYDLSGALAPAYQVNSLLGDLPGIGELLVSRKGEGIVAFSYSVKGAVEEPVVTVNALSLLTPGFLRRIFEPLGRQERASTDEILNEAISVSESLAQSADIEAEDIKSHPLPPVVAPRAEP